jgi:hypothetical protein
MEHTPKTALADDFLPSNAAKMCGPNLTSNIFQPWHPATLEKPNLGFPATALVELLLQCSPAR